MASMTSPEQGAQQECISTLLRPAGRSSLGRTSSDMADKTGKDGRCGRKNPYFTTSWRKAGRRPARPGRLSPAPSSRVRARRPARPATGRARRGPFHALQPHLVLHPAQRAVGVAGLQGQVGRDQAGFARQPQQGDIAQVAHQHRVAARMAQHQILGDEFHVHHAARVVLQVEIGRGVGMARIDLAAHFQHFLAQRRRIARLHQDVGANALEALADRRVAGGMAGAGQGLVLPGPGVLALVLLEGFDRHRQQAGVAVRPQPQVDFVQPARRGHGGQPGGHAPAQLGVDLGGVVARVVEQEHQVRSEA